MNEDDVRERFGITVECCESCHEDLDEGWGACTIEVDGQEVSVCCAISRTFKSMVAVVPTMGSEPNQGTHRDHPGSHHP